MKGERVDVEFRLVGPNWCLGRRSLIKLDFEEFTLSFKLQAAHTEWSCRFACNQLEETCSLSLRISR